MGWSTVGLGGQRRDAHLRCHFCGEGGVGEGWRRGLMRAPTSSYFDLTDVAILSANSENVTSHIHIVALEFFSSWFVAVEKRPCISAESWRLLNI